MTDFELIFVFYALLLGLSMVELLSALPVRYLLIYLL